MGRDPGCMGYRVAIRAGGMSREGQFRVYLRGRDVARASMSREGQFRVYFLSYAESVEEQRYLTEVKPNVVPWSNGQMVKWSKKRPKPWTLVQVRRETEAFKGLIEAKATMVVGDGQDGKSGAPFRTPSFFCPFLYLRVSEPVPYPLLTGRLRGRGGDNGVWSRCGHVTVTRWSRGGHETVTCGHAGGGDQSRSSHGPVTARVVTCGHSVVTLCSHVVTCGHGIISGGGYGAGEVITVAPDAPAPTSTRKGGAAARRRTK
eukprot:3727441-Rhodomonas_salina.1